ncbi:CocE/NonD family hydrolase [Streptomyces similanensis]|uniref:CocE/NonD family hydrolase n=1 Tax=Streptomyces similanensis TaxID=1274988 RepID=A0ABP9LFS5_9ACTN
MPLVFERIDAAPVPPQARQHWVRMRDGVRLATDLYLPEDHATEGERPDGGLPTVLIRLPYDKNSKYVYSDHIAGVFTSCGYAVVVQDVRGKFRSGGRTLPFLREPLDGYDTIEWIVRQPWSDGAVGMFGDSYYGFTQWAAVASEHPALRAIVPRVTTVDFNATVRRWDSETARTGKPVWLEGIEYYAHHWVGNAGYEYEPDRTVRPFIEQYEQVFAAIGARSTWFDLLAPGHTDVLHALGRHPFDARPVPVLHCVGWYDNIGLPNMRDYLALAVRPAWNAVQYLWAGAIDHENYQLDLAPVAPENDHGADEEALKRMMAGYTGPAVEFFEVFLKGTRPASSLARVTWELGHAGWRTAESWPPPGAVEHVLHLGAPADAVRSLPGGTLADEATEGEESVQWAYDPESPVPSAVPDSFAYLQHHPDVADTVARDDVLVFSGPALTSPLDLAGPVTLDLHVSSSAPVFDVFARLLDVAPDGSARMIVRGQTTVRQEPAGDETPIELGHTGYRLRAGHRLALMLASSDYPMYLPASGSTENPWTVSVAKPSTQTLRTGAAAPSRLTVTTAPPMAG